MTASDNASDQWVLAGFGGMRQATPRTLDICGIDHSILHQNVSEAHVRMIRRLQGDGLVDLPLSNQIESNEGVRELPVIARGHACTPFAARASDALYVIDADADSR